MDTTPELPHDGPTPGAPDEPAAAIPTEAIPASTEANLLDDVEYVLYQASAGKRFANYLIDTVIFYFAWRFAIAYWFAQILIWLRFPLDNRAFLYLVAYLGAMLFFGLIVGGLEAATGGKTIGKYITGTRAVTDQGVPVNGKKALLRFLAREVPFEAFSALGSPCYPWHDRWTKTVVIDEKLTTLPLQD